MAPEAEKSLQRLSRRERAACGTNIISAEEFLALLRALEAGHKGFREDQMAAIGMWATEVRWASQALDLVLKGLRTVRIKANGEIVLGRPSRKRYGKDRP